MPKLTAEQVIEDLKKKNTLGDVITAMATYGENIDPNDANDTELAGLKATFQVALKTSDGVYVTPESGQKLVDVNNAFLEYKTKLQLDAYKKIEDVKQRINQGLIPGTEFMIDDDKEKVDNLAKNIFVAENPDFVKRMKGCETAYKAFQDELDGKKIKAQNNNAAYDGVLLEYLQNRGNEFTDNMFAQRNEFQPEAQNKDKILGINPNELKVENKDGFEFNTDYKPNVEGSQLIKKKPEELEEFAGLNTSEQYLEKREELEFKKDACDKYVDNAKVLASNARAMLKELDAVTRTDGKQDSQEYKNMRSALETLSKLDQPTQLTDDQVQPPNYVPAEINDALDTLTKATESYDKKNAAAIKGHDFGRERLNMSKRLHNLAEIAKPVMDPKRYGIDEFASIDAVKAEQNKRLDRLEAARQKKGFEPFEPHKKKERTVEEKIANAKKSAEAAKQGVKGGSSEYDKATAHYDKIAEAYKKFKEIKEDPEMDNNQRRVELEKVSKEMARSREDMDKYITRKKNKGQIQAGSTVDLKSQKRINAIKEGINVVKGIESEIGAYLDDMIVKEEALEAEDVVKVEETNAEMQKITNTKIANEVKILRGAADAEQEGSYMHLAAKLAKKAYNKLYEIKNNNPDAPLAPEDKEMAYGAMGAFTYYSMLCDLNKQQINANHAADKDQLKIDANYFMNTKEFKRVLGDGSEINREQITDFLAEPTALKERIKQNRDKVRQINANVDAQQQRQANDQPQANVQADRLAPGFGV